MNRPLILTVDLAGLALVPFLFRTLGPRRAVLIAIFGGLLVLPRGAQVLALGPATIELNKFLVSGLAVLLGVVLFDRRALLRARPDWLDLPMAACVASPLVSMAVNGFDRPREFLDGAWWKLAAWVVPYLLGRIYFGDAAGTSRVVVGVMAAGLLYIPVCLFETALGPRWYLLGVIYGIPPHEGVAHRLGGWRPEGMLNSGLELAAWMALASVVACWTWLSRSGVRLWRLPAWVPALALTSTSLACRGTYGYLLLGAGLLATALTQALRTRLVLVTLMLLPLVYIGLRVSGAWTAGNWRRSPSKWGGPARSTSGSRPSRACSTTSGAACGRSPSATGSMSGPMPGGSPSYNSSASPAWRPSSPPSSSCPRA